MLNLPRAAVILCALTGIATADECREIDNDLDRLACYDLQSGRTPKAESVQTDNKWDVRIESSDFDDTKSVFISTKSESDLSCGFLSQRPATLTIRCMENTTSVLFTTNCHVTDIQDYGKVDVRLDRDPAFVVNTYASTNNKTLGLWEGHRSIPFIKKMFGKDQMVIRFTPFSESPVTAKFDVSGLEETIKPLRESCGW